MTNQTKEYLTWQDKVLTDPQLREAARTAAWNMHSVDIRVVALTIAKHGRFGRSCFAFDTTIASEVGCSAKTVQRYRRMLVMLGWLTEQARGSRGYTHDIATPTTGEADGTAAA